MKLYSRLLTVFWSTNMGIWTHFGEVKGDAWPWLMARWKAHGRLSIHVNKTFFRYLLRFRSYETKCVQLGCFHRRSTSLHSNFIRTGSSPINHSWHQKTRDTGLHDGEGPHPPRSVVLTQYQSVTDRQTDMPPVAFTGLAKLALHASFAARCQKLSHLS